MNVVGRTTITLTEAIAVRGARAPAPENQAMIREL
jgi:hypothetical protein